MDKEQQVYLIENEILKTKQSLRKLRYAIIMNYYHSQPKETQTQIQESVQANDIVEGRTELECDQEALHPSLKKLIGKQPKTINVRSKTGRFNQASNEQSNPGYKPVICSSRSSHFQESKMIQLNSSRGRNKLKHTIIVGNTSQYLREETTAMSYKWMCYVKTKSSVSIEKLVKKVRFFLDPSYKPNDIVDVSAPFQLTRRGYDEFQIKVLIIFNDDLNLKPVTVYHQLNLDKKFTGYQTLGNETINELYTRNFLNEQETETIVAKCNTDSVKHDHDYHFVDKIAMKHNEDIDDDEAPMKNNSDVIRWIDEFSKNYSFDKSRDESESENIELI